MSAARDSEQQEDLWELLRMACDNVATPADWQQLNGRLVESETTRAMYLAYAELHAELRWLFCVKSESPVNTDEPPHVTAHAGGTASTLPATTPVFPILTDPVSRRLNVHQHRWALGAASLVAAALFWTFWAYLINAGRDDLLRRPHETDIVATYQVHDGAQRTELDPSDAKSLRAGEALETKRGIVQLNLKQGVTLWVEGPARWSIVDGNHAKLESGKIVAKVPSQAVGFTLDTPSARIVDLGTEFGVETDPKGATEVQVFKGKIELRPNARGKDPAAAGQSITLTAGMARRLEPADKEGNYAIREIPSKPENFARPGPPSQRMPIIVSDAIASSTSFGSDQRARNLVNGSGMRGDRHGCLAAGTMWLSAPDIAKDQFLLFDLGRRYRLDTIKIWNYNDEQYDGFHTSSVKQIDIYVSNLGEGDPISKPTAWTLAVTDQPVAQATGKSDYVTPTSVSLPQVEGRYVAIVIDDVWQNLPHVATPLFTFGAQPSVKFNDSSNSPAMYGSEFVTSEAIVAVGLGAWIGDAYRVLNRTNSDYTATLYRVENTSLRLERRVTIPAGTAIDRMGFAFVPLEFQLDGDTHYVVAAHLGKSTVRKTPYVYGLEAGTFGFGTTFIRDRYAHTEDDKTIPTLTAESLKLGPLIGGNLLIQPNVDIAHPSARTQEMHGVGLSEVQFFGTRVETTSAVK